MTQPPIRVPPTTNVWHEWLTREQAQRLRALYAERPEDAIREEPVHKKAAK